MSVLAQAFITPQQYLQRERQAEYKSEYWNGEIFAMAGASRAHNQIVSNIIAALSTQLRDKPCSVYPGDMKVKVQQKYTYPDVTVCCDPELFEDEQHDVLLNPRVLIEVLSDSTEAYDRGLKFFHYQAITSFQEYLLVSQEFCRIEQFTRHVDNTWIYRQFHALDEVVELKSFGCVLALAEVYRRVVR
jgi:Uma2 family endonuclease